MKGMTKPSYLLVVVLAASLLSACGREGPIPPADKMPPMVKSTIPANGSVDVPVNLNGGITILFTKEMDAATINDQTITLADGQNNVPGSIAYTDIPGGSYAVFSPSSTLNPATLYQITVGTNVRDSYGISMTSPYISSFNTGTSPDTTHPVVIGTTPGNGAVNVQPNAAIIITFSEPVDPGTITFTLSAGGLQIDGNTTYNGTTAIFTPSASLAYGTEYTATVSAGVEDLAGNPMPSDYLWSFMTGTAPDTLPPVVTATTPATGAAGVAVNIIPSATFSEPVNPATISFTLSAGDDTVPCTMSYNGTTAIFTPSASLAYGTLYTAAVSRGVQDLAENAMLNDYLWSFMTGTAPDTLPPGVTATTPAPGAAGVAINITPSVTFSEPVDQATVTFALSAGNVPVAGNITYSGTTAIFTPSGSLAYSTQYRATVSAGVKDLAGNAMQNDYLWSFMTGTAADTLPPGVTAASPAPGATGVAANIAPSVTFSEPVDAATITFTLSAGGNAVPCTMSYSGTTAIFTPSVSLAYGTLYTATVSSGVKDLSGNAMSNGYFWSFMTGTAPDTLPPGVTATTPAPGATGVAVNIAPSVTFSEPVDQATITITLSAGNVPVAGNITYNGTTAIFTPSVSLAYSTLYTATVSAGVRDLAGNAMPSDYFWSFMTGTAPDTLPPGVTATTPATGAAGVAVNIAPSVTFSEPVDQTTIAFTLSAGGAAIPCTMSYSGTTAIFTPSVSLTYGTLYTATVSAGVRDLAGNAMPNDYVWNFTTGAAPDTLPPSVTATTPAPGATGVAVTIAPGVTFSEPVDQGTIAFTLSTGDVPVAGNITYNGTTAIFTPSASLAYSTQYTATVSAGVKDLAGNAMPNGYFWSFMTGTALDMIPPSVTATTPAIGATGVAANIAPSVTFSEPVDPTTITFTLSAGGNDIPCTMSYSGTTATITPSINLKKNMLHTARVSAGVRDLAGNAMPNDYFWSFTTSKN
jgi:predicted small lipoprotein YifL/methionine-rich copper-binding protein CopC